MVFPFIDRAPSPAATATREYPSGWGTRILAAPTRLFLRFRYQARGFFIGHGLPRHCLEQPLSDLPAVVGAAVGVLGKLAERLHQRANSKWGLSLSPFSRGLPSPSQSAPQRIATPSIDAARSINRPSRSKRARLFQSRSEEHTSELQSLMRISYAVFCLKKKK